jgi:hypothetical protein
MFSNAGTLLDRLQGLFSKGFIVGGIVPVVLLFFINWGLLFYFFPMTYESWASYIVPPKNQEILYWAKVILILFVGGLVFWNLNPWLRQFMEGRFLPQKLRRWLSSELGRRFKDLFKKRDQLAIELFDYRKNVPGWEDELAVARQAGSGKPGGPVSKKLKEAFGLLTDLHNSFEDVPFPGINDVFKILKKELAEKSTKGNELDKIHTGFIKLANEAWMNLENKYDKLSTDLRQRFPDDFGRIGPTSMANFAEVHRDYGLDRFGLDIELFWIRLLKVIRGDADFYPMLEEAKNQLDFSIALTSVLGVTTMVWVPLSLFADGFWPFVLIGFLGPVATTISYHVAVQSYRGFSEVVRSAIDLNRFKLLELLHVALPSDSEMEKKLWKELAEGKSVIVYKHGAAPAIPRSNPPAPLSLLSRIKKFFGLS